MPYGGKKLLFVGRGADGAAQPLDGGEYGARRVWNMVQRYMPQENLDALFIKKPNITGRILNMVFRSELRAYPPGRFRLKKRLQKPYHAAFFNGSIYGSYVRLAAAGKVKPIVFYHNVEAVFYRQKYQSSGLLQDYAMYRYIEHNERICTQHAEHIITLNERDSRDLRSLYGRDADCCLPTSYPCVDLSKIQPAGPQDYLLFVGGNFFANVEGITVSSCRCCLWST
jgi:glycosyltransferase involved in cell wall biosynthesis